MSLFLVLLFPLTNCYFLDSNSNKITRTKRETEFCPRERTPCVTPMKYSDTERFKCDDACPFGYNCCPDTCFQHKICKKSSNSLEFCPRDKNLCSTPLPCGKTKEFSCFDDNECPSGYVCCKDSCFVHKICKEKVSIVTTPLSVTEQEETTTEKEDEETTPLPTTTETEEKTTLVTTEDEETTPVPATTEAEEETTLVTTEDEETTPVPATTEAEEETTFATTEAEEETTFVPTEREDEEMSSVPTTGVAEETTSGTTENAESPISTTTEDDYLEEYYDKI